MNASRRVTIEEDGKVTATAAGWPGRTAGLVEPVRLIALDHPHQAPIDSGGLRHAAYARIDMTHELPIVIHDRDGEVMARFSAPADAAFYLTGRLSLPAELLAALEIDSDG